MWMGLSYQMLPITQMKNQIVAGKIAMNSENDSPSFKSVEAMMEFRSLETILKKSSAIHPPVYAMLNRIGAANRTIGSIASSPG